VTSGVVEGLELYMLPFAIPTISWASATDTWAEIHASDNYRGLTDQKPGLGALDNTGNGGSF